MLDESENMESDQSVEKKDKNEDKLAVFVKQVIFLFKKKFF